VIYDVSDLPATICEGFRKPVTDVKRRRESNLFRLLAFRSGVYNPELTTKYLSSHDIIAASLPVTSA
jgi:hypothetical protein